MEGLIPMVYKTIMKTKVRRQYKSISSGGVADTHNTYDITKFSPDGYPHHQCKSLSSSGGAVSTCNSYDITKFYPDGYNYSYPTPWCYGKCPRPSYDWSRVRDMGAIPPCMGVRPANIPCS